GQVRFQGPAIAASKGAAAVVIRSVGTDHHRMPHTGQTNFAERSAAIPAAALSVPDAENLARMLERGKPVVMHLVVTPRSVGEQLSGNVVAEVPGTDPDAGIVLVGGHLDSWDLGTGAIDDAAGVAITAAAARHLLDLPERPRRTIRVVWWGSEEVGGFGSKDYFARHKQENVVLVGESDFGADRVWRLRTGFAAADKGLGDRLAAALAPLGIVSAAGTPEGGADVEQWMGAGVAAFDLNQDGTRYFDLHHTADDTLDKIDKEQLRQNVAAWATTLWIAANGSGRIARTKE
ncbi:MAG: M20/M25/M40 family metallo-hydrolase, partial [Sphingomonadales bacterium]